MTSSAKSELMARVRADLSEQLAKLQRIVREATAAATDPGSKAESKYDTRSLEASYLAQGQARQVAELSAAIERLEGVVIRDFAADDAAACGAWVELVHDEASESFFLLPAGGGHVVDYGGRQTTILSPESPLYQAILGSRVGDSLPQTGHWISEIV